MMTQPVGGHVLPGVTAGADGADGADSSAQTFEYAEEESTRGESFVTVLSVAALIIAVVALVFQLMTANIWLEGNWGDLFG